MKEASMCPDSMMVVNFQREDIGGAGGTTTTLFSLKMENVGEGNPFDCIPGDGMPGEESPGEGCPGDSIPDESIPGEFGADFCFKSGGGLSFMGEA